MQTAERRRFHARFDWISGAAGWMERGVTVLTILGSVGALIVALITVWNTATVSRHRLRLRHAVRARRERRELARRVASFASEPALIEFEARFDEIAEAYQAKQIPHDLRVLWGQVFRLAGESPFGRPFRYGPLEVHQDMNAMTVRNGFRSITGRDWLEGYPLPLSTRSTTKPSDAPIRSIKDCATPSGPRQRTGSHTVRSAPRRCTDHSGVRRG